VIDLYQLHWPNRGSYHFRQIWGYPPPARTAAETLTTCRTCWVSAADLVAEGKIRHIGLSNESVWGTAQWLRLAEDRMACRAWPACRTNIRCSAASSTATGPSFR
jgi:aryl-alcohol dehydrogenase-like predicted oxidoreductase